MNDKAAVAMCDLTLGYQRHPAVHHVNCEIESGSLTALIGPNGAGKTTLLRSLAGELKPLGGSIVKKPRLQTAFLPQTHNIDFSVPMTVEETVAMGLWDQIGLLAAVGEDERRKIDSALEAVKLAPGDRRLLGKLSGGVLQRVLFARLMLREADLILLDEPFQAVDRGTIRDLFDVISRWHEDGKTVIISLHDLEIVRTFFPQAMLIARDLLAHGPSREIATLDNLERARGLCAGFDERARECEQETGTSKLSLSDKPGDHSHNISSTTSLHGR